jgi:N-acetylneuraminic acid mutarotase
MNSFLIIALAVLFVAPPGLLQAQVPQLISYQGRVGVDGVNFDGSGQFKFAFVNAAGTTTYWSNDGSSTAGSEPGTAINIPVSKGLYAVLLGDATLAHMSIVPATVFTHGDVHLRVWFSDGVNGFQQLTPDRRIAAVGYAMMADSVSDGAITTAKIADGAVTSAKLAAGVVQTANLATGAVGNTQLAVGAAAANLGAGSVGTSHLADSAVTSVKIASGAVGAGHLAFGAAVSNIATGTISGSQIANGAIGAAQLSSGAAAANLASSGLTGVTSGGIILSSEDNQDLVNAGYTKVGTAQLPTGAPAARTENTAVWTGSEMLIWGGRASDGTSRFLTDVGAYNSATGRWKSAISPWSPAGRSGHTAIWSGAEMIVWGGSTGSLSNDGGRYNPTTGVWTSISSEGTMTPRYQHTAIWTGTIMVIWGGSTTNTGARYTPTTNTWTSTTTSGAPVGRSRHVAVWSGTEMIVWGGEIGAPTPTITGGRYNPVTNTWVTMNTNGAPSPRIGCSAVWNGSEMLVWGGYGSNTYQNNGARYNPSNDTWTPLTTVGAPPGRSYHFATWTGTEMIVWGGTGGEYGDSIVLRSGGRYNPSSDSWSSIDTNGAPSIRSGETGVWTGNEMILWGGGYNAGIYDDGARYSPSTDSWKLVPSILPMSLYQRP